MVTMVTSTGSERLSASFVHQVDPEADEGAEVTCPIRKVKGAGEADEEDKPKKELLHLYR